MGRRYQLFAALLLALSTLAPIARSSQLSAVPEYGLPDLPISQPVFTLFAAQGEQVELRIPRRKERGIRLTRDGQPFGKPVRDGWRFQAPPEPGLYRMRLESAAGGEGSRISLFVGYPVEYIEDGRLNGYLIGQTPPSHKKYPSLYRAPEVYYEVTPANIDTRLSPHFTLRQFLCKQASDFPKYVVLRESLLLLLEGLVQEVREAGFPVQTLGVISGYRTPWYNQSIGNVSNSRHVYGDAFDFFVDVDGDGRMDDLNGNGRHDRGDVDLLADLVDRFMRRPENAALLGGLGRYYKTSRHGGFVHVDTRGFAARW